MWYLIVSIPDLCTLTYFKTTYGYKLLPFEGSLFRKMINIILINIKHIAEKKLIEARVMKGKILELKAHKTLLMFFYQIYYQHLKNCLF